MMAQHTHYMELIVPLDIAETIVNDIVAEGWKLKDYCAAYNGSKKIAMIASVPVADVNLFKLKYQEYMRPGTIFGTVRK